VQAILEPVEDYLSAAELPGAGGGGYLLMFAKDDDAAERVRRQLLDRPPNDRARFVDLSVSRTGLESTRS
jgi:galactokinase/mevalonate kinase-like predicted kinase